MGIDEEKLRSLHKQVIKVISSIKKSFLLIKLSHGTHGMGWDEIFLMTMGWDGMGWDESNSPMGRFFRPIPSHSEPCLRPYSSTA